jgi:hypothetical protein
MPRRPNLLALPILLAGGLLAACDRDREARLRQDLAQWFFLSDTLYFKSMSRCTGAIITVTVGRPRPALAVQPNTDQAVRALLADGVAAVQSADVSPAELTDRMLKEGTGAFGRQVLAAGALAGECLDEEDVEDQIFAALTRPNAILAYDSGNSALMILDPARNRLFYLAGDAW